MADMFYWKENHRPFDFESRLFESRLREEEKAKRQQSILAWESNNAYYTYFFSPGTYAYDLSGNGARFNQCLSCASLVLDKGRDQHIEWHFPPSVGRHAAE